MYIAPIRLHRLAAIDIPSDVAIDFKRRPNDSWRWPIIGCCFSPLYSRLFQIDTGDSKLTCYVVLFLPSFLLTRLLLRDILYIVRSCVTSNSSRYFIGLISLQRCLIRFCCCFSFCARAGFPFGAGMETGSFASHDGFSHAGICSGKNQTKPYHHQLLLLLLL